MYLGIAGVVRAPTKPTHPSSSARSRPASESCVFVQGEGSRTRARSVLGSQPEWGGVGQAYRSSTVRKMTPFADARARSSRVNPSRA